MNICLKAAALRDGLSISEEAKHYYQPETYDHAVRVAGYIRDNPLIPDALREICTALALMHDLLEDTEYQGDVGDDRLRRGLHILTRPVGMEYITYIRRIRESAARQPEVYWVKLADMKDHLAQTETLTDRLKEKYIKALPYLL